MVRYRKRIWALVACMALLFAAVPSMAVETTITGMVKDTFEIEAVAVPDRLSAPLRLSGAAARSLPGRKQNDGGRSERIGPRRLNVCGS